jgi:hypothetical protein
MTRRGVGIPSGVNVISGDTVGGRGVKVTHEQATLLPLDLDVSGLPVTVVSGGGAALRRIGALREDRAAVTVVAAHVVPAIEDLADRGQSSAQWSAPRRFRRSRRLAPRKRKRDGTDLPERRATGGCGCATPARDGCGPREPPIPALADGPVSVGLGR